MNYRFLPGRSIRFRIVTAMALIFCAGLWALSHYFERVLREDLRGFLSAQQLASTSMAASRIHDMLVYRLGALEKVSTDLPLLFTGEKAKAKDELVHRAMLNAFFDGGVFVCHFKTKASEESQLNQEFCHQFLLQHQMIDALKRGKPSIGQLIWSKNSQEVCFSIGVPIRDVQGNIAGALVGLTKLSEDNFLDKLTDKPVAHSGDIVVVALPQKLVISATDDRLFLKTISVDGLGGGLEKFLEGGEGSLATTNFNQVEVLASAKLVPSAGWMVLTVLPTSVVFSSIAHIERYLHIGIVCFIVFICVLSWFVLQHQLAPLTTAVNIIDDMVHNRQMFAILPVDRHDEVGRLIHSFNHLLTILHRREDSLRESEIFSRAILDSVPAQISVLDRDGTVSMVNQPWMRFSWTLNNGSEHDVGDTLVGVNFLQACKNSSRRMNNADAALVADGISAVLDERLPSFSMEYLCDKTADSHWFNLAVTPLDHEMKGAVVSHTDITERKEMEEALRLVWASVQAASDAIFWLSHDGSMIDINVAACRLLGYSEQELLQLPMEQLNPEWNFTALQRAQRFLSVKDFGVIKFECTLHTKSAETISVEVTANYIQHGSKEFVCAFVRDISERQRIGVALEFAKGDAERANNAKSRFLAAASHDLRQPLSAISLYVDLLKKNVPKESSDVVTKIQGCVVSMSELLTDLLDLSKLDAGVIKVKTSVFSLDDVLKRQISIFSAESSMKNLCLRLHGTEVLAATDQRLLHRIIGNLISNAIRYTRTGGVLVACRFHEGKRWVEVWDTGVGIPADKIDFVFEEFRQLGDDSRNRGSGLGLAIVKKMAVLLGLEIRVCSRLGHGSMFAIEIPVLAKLDAGEDPLAVASNE